MDISICAYNKKDYDQVLDVTMTLWHLKMKPYTKKSMSFNKHIIDDTKTIPKTINNGIYVAKINGKVAGVIHIHFQGKITSHDKGLNVCTLIFKYGLFKLLKVRKMSRLFDVDVKKDELHIHGIAVDKAYRKKGIATKLISYVTELAKQKQLKKVTLDVLDTNENAYRLYLALNFKVTGKTIFNKREQKAFKAYEQYHMTLHI